MTSAANETANATDLPEKTLEAFDGDELAARAFLEKYALRDDDGNLLETTPREMWRRLAKEIASVEDDSETEMERREEFEWLLTDFKFVPGGRIMHAAGNSRNVSLTNCYHTSIEEDSLEGIYKWCQDAAKTYSRGGGNGVDVGVLRPRGHPVDNCARTSTGAVSFMDQFSYVTGLVGQEGRRGALLISIPVDHPDVEEFIDCKTDDLNHVRYANISVKLSDEFMGAVENGDSFTLRFEDDKGRVTQKIVDARTLWDKIAKSAWSSAEPGIMFWDNVVDESPSEYCAPVVGTNACSEQPLESNGACTLGHVNLSTLVDNEFTENSSVDWAELKRRVRTGVRFLDNVVEYNLGRHALESQEKQASATRRIGLGITGLADMFVKLGIKYDSDDAIAFIDELMAKIRNWAYESSADIAAEKEPFPFFEADKHLQRPFVQRLPADVQERIADDGLRNVCILTVAPVGTGSLLCRTSSGIEPIFQLKYKRRSESLSQENFEVSHPLVQEYIDTTGGYDLPDTFITSHEIDAYNRIRIQGTIQKYVDSAISSTVNVSKDTTVEEIKDIYKYAWKMGCKSVSVYRSGSREGILLDDGVNDEELDETRLQPSERPDVLVGKTYKVPSSQGTLYINITDLDGRPSEMFVTVGKSGSYTNAFTEAIARMISLHLRSGGDIADVVDQLVGIRGPDVTFTKYGRIYSVPDALGRVLDKHVDGAVDGLERRDGSSPECPECHSPLTYQEGCKSCAVCGWSRC